MADSGGKVILAAGRSGRNYPTLAIRQLLGDPGQARSLGERARQRYEAKLSAAADLRALIWQIEDIASKP